MKKYNIKNNYTYFCNVKNMNFDNAKIRPIIVLKQRSNKILILPITTRGFKPIWLNKKLSTPFKGADAYNAHWTLKSNIIENFDYQNKHVKISKSLSKQIYQWIIRNNNRRIKGIKKRMHKRIPAYLKTGNQHLLNLIKNDYQKWKHYNFNNNCQQNLDKYIDSFVFSKSMSS